MTVNRSYKVYNLASPLHMHDCTFNINHKYNCGSPWGFSALLSNIHRLYRIQMSCMQTDTLADYYNPLLPNRVNIETQHLTITITAAIDYKPGKLDEL